MSVHSFVVWRWIRHGNSISLAKIPHMTSPEYTAGRVPPLYSVTPICASILIAWGYCNLCGIGVFALTQRKDQ
jgi:hypothetical protein